MALETKEFIDRLIQKGYTHLCVVPCSFAKYVINEAINNPNIEYLPCASEAVACSVAAGLKMSGQKPIIIVQSSGVTNMGSCITSLLKPYGVTFPILTSWRTYKAGDSEIQHQHLATQLPTLIEAYGYEHELLDSEDTDKALALIDKCDTTHTICMIQKDSFSKVELLPKHKLELSSYETRGAYLKMLDAKYAKSDVLFIGTTGNTAREMYSLMPQTNNFYMVGNMGGALSLGLGAAKGGKKVIVCGGDAEFVMHMGGLSTAGRYKNEIDLTYILFDNESNKSTGGQNTYQKHVDYNTIAKACGFKTLEKTVTAVAELEGALELKGLSFIHVKCGIDEETPRPPVEAIVKRSF